MTTLWKDVLKVGKWQLRDGRTFACSTADLDHYERRIKDMIADGLSVPISWEHQPSLKPSNPDEDRAARTKLVLGRAADARTEDDALEIALEVPDETDAKRLPAVRFVSPYIEWDFVDGSGKKWDGPSITHIAVTPRPIQHTQKPFAPFDTSRPLGTAPIALSIGDFEERGPREAEEAAGEDLCSRICMPPKPNARPLALSAEEVQKKHDGMNVAPGEPEGITFLLDELEKAIATGDDPLRVFEKLKAAIAPLLATEAEAVAMSHDSRVAAGLALSDDVRQRVRAIVGESPSDRGHFDDAGADLAARV